MVGIILIIVALPLVGGGFIMRMGLENPEILRRTKENINYDEMSIMEKVSVETSLEQIRKQATVLTLIGLTIIICVIFFIF